LSCFFYRWSWPWPWTSCPRNNPCLENSHRLGLGCSQSVCVNPRGRSHRRMCELWLRINWQRCRSLSVNETGIVTMS